MRSFLILFVVFISNSSNAQQWRIIYENDALGKVVNGDIEALKNAVREGREIRIGWGFQHPERNNIRVEHVAEASFLTIQSDAIIHAQISPIYGQTPDFEAGSIILKENLEWVFIGGTNGKMDTMTRNTITGEIVNHRQRTSAFKWFVREN